MLETGVDALREPEVPFSTYPTAIVAVVLWHQGRMALLKRSGRVHHDTGMWHCVTGYLEASSSPRQQAVQEILEETGLAPSDLRGFAEGPVIDLTDETGAAWRVHTFRAEVLQHRLTLNWEHDVYQWVAPARIGAFGHVAWLSQIIHALDAA